MGDFQIREGEQWVKLHAKIIDSAVFHNEKLLKMWVWLLLKARRKESVMLVGYQNVVLKPGELILGRYTASEEVGFSPSTVRNLLAQLSKMGNLDIKTSNKFSIVKIKNWSLYQTEGQQSKNKIKTNGQQIATSRDGETVRGRDIPLTPRERGEHPRAIGSNPRSIAESVKDKKRKQYEQTFFEEHGYYPPA